MNEEIKKKILDVCNKKIFEKWDNVWVSFYAFFSNKNNNPEKLMEVANWWIMENKFDHFEKTKKIIEKINS
jgi:hypothetical protein